MKKTLVAIAALTAVSAFAQSSVTIYGRVNNGFTVSEAQDKDGIKTKASGMTQGSWTSSRIGVTVNEDLGNGMSSQAVWESDIGSTYDTAATTTVRQAFVGLKDSKLGTIQAGAMYMPEYGQGITVAGTVNSLGQGTEALVVAKPKETTSVHRLGTTDKSNMINYIAPKMGDVTLSAQVGTTVAQVVSATGTNTTDTKGDLMGLSANFAQGPLNATASYSTVKKSALAVSAVAGVVPTASVAYTAPIASAAAADTTQKNTTLSATYALGAVNLFGYYANREISGTKVFKYTTTNLGANYTMGALTPFVSFSSGTLKSATATTSEPSATQVGVNYALSKRTNVYLYQAEYKDKLATTVNSYKASQTSFGIAHAF